MLQGQKEKRILKLSFTAGLIFAIAEFFFAIFSCSQSALTDAVYDAIGKQFPDCTCELLAAP